VIFLKSCSGEKTSYRNHLVSTFHIMRVLWVSIMTLPDGQSSAIRWAKEFGFYIQSFFLDEFDHMPRSLSRNTSKASFHPSKWWNVMNFPIPFPSKSTSLAMMGFFSKHLPPTMKNVAFISLLDSSSTHKSCKLLPRAIIKSQIRFFDPHPDFSKIRFGKKIGSKSEPNEKPY